MKATLLYSCKCILAEGPLWHAERNSCFWVNIEGNEFYEYSWLQQTVTRRSVDYKVTLLVQDNHGQLLLGLHGGLARYNLDTEQLTWVMDLEKDISDHRCNDGKADSRGRLWVGTMHMGFKPGAGTFYSIDETLQPQKKHEQVTISNGLAWSIDNTRLYYIDSPTHKVQSFLFDEETGDIQFEKIALHIPESMGTPDGMCIDEEGMLWIAHWGGFAVYRWNPLTGECLDKIELPVPDASSCAFVGGQLEYLLITTAAQDVSADNLIKYPESGSVFIVKPGVKGAAAYKCRI